MDGVRRADELGRWPGSGLLVLASLADGAKHGYAITTNVAEQVGVTLGPGTLYAALASPPSTRAEA
ncbi:hypothetical protein [Actinoplanes sp. NPDC051411]|uniref:hypothetical protein n=1 Tax=Actinoplanes sp. NPDC051411 TaxID=3155522 RepID=UPI003412D31D